MHANCFVLISWIPFLSRPNGIFSGGNASFIDLSILNNALLVHSSDHLNFVTGVLWYIILLMHRGLMIIQHNNYSCFFLQITNLPNVCVTDTM